MKKLFFLLILLIPLVSAIPYFQLEEDGDTFFNANGTSGDLTITGKYIGEELQINQDANVSGNLSVWGDITYHGNLSSFSPLNVFGNILVFDENTGQLAIVLNSSDNSISMGMGGGDTENVLNLRRRNFTVDTSIYHNFEFYNDLDEAVKFARIGAGIEDPLSDFEKGYISWGVRDTGTLLEKMRLTFDGFLGLGTDSPSQRLDVRGSGNFSGTIYINNNTDISSFENQWNTSSAVDPIRYYIYPSDLDRSLGINTTSPSHLLNVVGDANITQDLYVNEIKVNSWLYNQTLAGDIRFVNVDGDTMTGNLALAGANVTGITRLEAPDRSSIAFGNDAIFTNLFSGMDQAIAIGTNQTLSAGVITHAFLEMQGRKVLRFFQSGKNNSGSYMGNSQIIAPNNLSTNLSLLSDCFWVLDELGMERRLDCGTSSTGADLIVQDSIQAQQLFLDDGNGRGQLRVEGSADFIMRDSSTDFNILGGPLHQRSTKTVTLGESIGQNLSLVAETFESGTLDTFVSNDGWLASSETDCPEHLGIGGDFCAVEDGTNTNSRMTNNLSATNWNLTSLTFILSSNLDGPGSNDGTLTVYLNNNSGGSDVELYQLSAADATDTVVSVPINASFTNQSVVSLIFDYTGTSLNNIWIDNIVINATAVATTTANVTRFESEIKFLQGDGEVEIIAYEADGSPSTTYLNITADFINFNANTSFASVTETQLNVTDSINVVNDVLVGRDVNASWFNGKFNFSTGSNLTFNGTHMEISGALKDLNYNQSVPSNAYADTLNVSAGAYTDLINATMGVLVYNHTVEANNSMGNLIYNQTLGSITSVTGNIDFNGGWTSGGLSVIGGDLYSQSIYTYNITALGVSTLNVNGSLMPTSGFSNQFDVGNSSDQWRNADFGGTVEAEEFTEGGSTTLTNDISGNAATVTNGIYTTSAWSGGDLGGTGLAATVNDDSHNHVYSNIDAFTEANLYTILSDVSQFYESGDSPTFLDMSLTGGDITGAGTSYLDIGEIGADRIRFGSSSVGANDGAYIDFLFDGSYVEIECRDKEGDGDLCQMDAGLYVSGGTAYFTNEIKARGGIADDGGNLILNDVVHTKGQTLIDYDGAPNELEAMDASLVVDASGTYAGYFQGHVALGQGGNLEVEDGGLCVGNAGCSGAITDGRAVFEGAISTGSTTSVAYNRIGSGAKDNAQVTDANDLYVTDDIEVDGEAYIGRGVGGTAGAYWTSGDMAENLETQQSRENRVCGGDVECYKESTTDNLDYGDVVCIDPTAVNAIMECTEANSRLAVGVVSETFVVNVGSNLGYPIGLAGIVPTWVTTENGEIYPGDLLVTSSKPGYAMKNNNARDGTVIGKSYDFCNKDECKIYMFIALS